jgi:endonuclease YncB( thermonuclease family)
MIEAVSVLLLAVGCLGASVHDGDTFRTADCVSHRLWGVDAVELDQICDGAPCGILAREALRDIIQNHTVVCDERGHSYDRVVSRCFVGNMDVSRRMVQLGWAVDVPEFSVGEYAGEERAARRAKRGIWAYKEFINPWAWRLRHNHGRRFGKR